MASSAAFLQEFDGMHAVPLQDASQGVLAVFLVLFVSLCAEQEENEVHSDTQQNTAQVAFRGLHAFILICTTFTSK